MKASELIEHLQRLVDAQGRDAEVLAQTAGCCAHGHAIVHVEAGVATDEVDAIVLRCE